VTEERLNQRRSILNVYLSQRQTSGVNTAIQSNLQRRIPNQNEEDQEEEEKVMNPYPN
jgi:hypothetical protein